MLDMEKPYRIAGGTDWLKAPSYRQNLPKLKSEISPSSMIATAPRPKKRLYFNFSGHGFYPTMGLEVSSENTQRCGALKYCLDIYVHKDDGLRAPSSANFDVNCKLSVDNMYSVSLQ